MTISMRDLFSQHGVTGRVLSLRAFLEEHPEVPNLSLREAHKRLPTLSDFPENRVEIFRAYRPLLQSVRNATGRLITELSKVTIASVPTLTGNSSAQSVNNARKRLLDSLKNFQNNQAIDQIITNLEGSAGVYANMRERRSFESALRMIDKITPIPGFPQITADTISTAQTSKDIPYKMILEFEDIINNKPVKFKKEVEATLKGYKGTKLSKTQIDQLLLLQDLFTGGREHKFRTGLLRAECAFGNRNYQKSVIEYDSLLPKTSGVVLKPEEKFVALRSAFAQLALGDEMFREKRSFSDLEREEIRRAYDKAASMFVKSGVSLGNPLRREGEAYLARQRAKLDKRLNFLGLWDAFVPVQRFTILQELAEEQIQEAINSVRSFMEFLDKADELIGQRFDLEAEISAEQKNLEISRLEVENASLGIDKIDIQIDLIEQQQRFLEASSILSGFSQIVKAIEDPTAIFGLGSIIVDFNAQNTELAHQKRMAEVEREIGSNLEEIASLQEQIKADRIGYLQQKLQFLEGGLLNAELYYLLAEINEKRARRHLEVANFLAYLFERALAFFLGLPSLEHIQFNYLNRSGGIFNAPTDLKTDFTLLKGIMAGMDQEKLDFFTESISLRELYPLQFSQFLETGVMVFDYSLYRFGKRRPAAHQCRLREVGVELVGLVPSTNFSGTLTHMGRYLVRDKNSTLSPKTTRLIPTDEQLAQALEEQRRQGLPADAVGGVLVYNLGPDPKELSQNTQFVSPPPPEVFTLKIFEGYGPTGLWRLELQEHEKLAISDILLHFAIVSRESDPFGLQPKIEELTRLYEAELAGGDSLDRISAFFLRQQFPDIFFALQSGEAVLELEDDDFPDGLTNLQFKMVIAQALDQEGKGLPGISVEISRPEFSFTQARVTGADGFSENLDTVPPSLPPDQRFPMLGAWQIRLPESTQFPQLGDLRLFFMYAFNEG